MFVDRWIYGYMYVYMYSMYEYFITAIICIFLLVDFAIFVKKKGLLLKDKGPFLKEKGLLLRDPHLI